MATGLVSKETERIKVVENFAEIQLQPFVDYWEDINSDPAILYEDFLNEDQNVTLWGEMSDADMTA